MRRILLAVLFVVGMIGIARADSLSIGDTLKNLPGAKQGVAFSLIENEVNYLTTIDLVAWKIFTLEAGYNSKDKIVAVASVDVINLKKLGCTVPVLDLIDLRLGVYGGYGHINSQSLSKSEWDAGVSATAITVKF